MKRLILICVLCALILPALEAQSESIGAKVGGGMAFFGGSDWLDGLDLLGGNNEIRAGFTAGLFFNSETNEWFSIQTELMYSLLGGAFSYYDPFLFDYVDSKITVTAMELAVLLMPCFRTEKGEVHIFAGPDLILVLGDISLEVKALGIAVSADIEPDNLVLFGIKGGIGSTRPLGKGALVTDFSYTRSLTEIFENDNTAVNGLLLTVGYRADF